MDEPGIQDNDYLIVAEHGTLKCTQVRAGNKY